MHNDVYLKCLYACTKPKTPSSSPRNILNKNNNNIHGYQRQIQDFPKGGAWVIAGMDFHTWTFCSGTYHAMHGQNVNGQNTGGQNTSQNCKVGQNAVHFMGQGKQNSNLIKKTVYMILMVK